MDLHQKRYSERAFAKTKIIATVGPACDQPDQLRDLAVAGVDLFRLNFAHGSHESLAEILASIRRVSDELRRPIGVLGDLSGPKIRLGTLPEEGVACVEGARFEFVRGTEASRPDQLTCTYEQLVDDLNVGDRVLLADGTVSMRVVDKRDDRAVCTVEQPGLIRTRQGINLPGVTLSTPSLTDKDRDDLAWALANHLDYVGLSFVRQAEDIRLLRAAIDQHAPRHKPHIVAKIEKMEAVSDLDAILEETDAVMVARGDLGVEVDIARVPALQKRIIRACNEHRVPVITATQMLDSMQTNELPTRAEASDVFNAVLDGSDAVMLSGETAIGVHPFKAVAMMSRIAHEAEQFVTPDALRDSQSSQRARALAVTEAVTLGAGMAAENFNADVVVVATHSGRTALALSKQRSKTPVLAVTDQPETARRLCLYWGVSPAESPAVHDSPEELLRFVVDWGHRNRVLTTGSRVVLVGSTNWSAQGHDMLLVHVIP